MFKLGEPLKILLKGSLISQLLAFLLVPVVTYVYSPKEFGEYAELLNWAIMFSPIFAFGMERAIPYVKIEQQTPLFFRLTYLSLKTLLFFAVLIFFGCYFSDFFEPLKLIIVLLLSFSFFYSMLLGYYLVSTTKYKEDSNLKVFQSLSVLFGQISIGLIKPVSICLLLAELFARILVLMLSLKKNVLFTNFSLYRGLRKFKQYYTYGLMSTLMVTLCVNLPVVLIAFIYGEVKAALYFLSIKLLLAPASLISVSIGRLYYVDCCRNNAEEKSNERLFKSNFCKLFLLGGGVYSVAAIALPLLVNTLAISWQGAEELMYILMPLAFVQFFATPLSMTLTAYDKQYYDFVVNFFRLVGVLVISSTSYVYGYEFKTFLLGFVCISMLSYLTPLFISLKLVTSKND